MDRKEARELQGKLNYTDIQMAQQVGISRVHWNRIKNGRSEMMPAVRQRLCILAETAQDKKTDRLMEWLIAVVVWAQNQIRR